MALFRAPTLPIPCLALIPHDSLKPQPFSSFDDIIYPQNGYIPTKKDSTVSQNHVLYMIPNPIHALMVLCTTHCGRFPFLPYSVNPLHYILHRFYAVDIPSIFASARKARGDPVVAYNRVDLPIVPSNPLTLMSLFVLSQSEVYLLESYGIIQVYPVQPEEQGCCQTHSQPCLGLEAGSSSDQCLVNVGMLFHLHGWRYTPSTRYAGAATLYPMSLAPHMNAFQHRLGFIKHRVLLSLGGNNGGDDNKMEDEIQPLDHSHHPQLSLNSNVSEDIQSLSSSDTASPSVTPPPCGICGVKRTRVEGDISEATLTTQKHQITDYFTPFIPTSNWPLKKKLASPTPADGIASEYPQLQHTHTHTPTSASMLLESDIITLTIPRHPHSSFSVLYPTSLYSSGSKIYQDIFRSPHGPLLGVDLMHLSLATRVARTHKKRIMVISAWHRLHSPPDFTHAHSNTPSSTHSHRITQCQGGQPSLGEGQRQPCLNQTDEEHQGNQEQPIHQHDSCEQHHQQNTHTALGCIPPQVFTVSQSDIDFILGVSPTLDGDMNEEHLSTLQRCCEHDPPPPLGRFDQHIHTGARHHHHHDRFVYSYLESTYFPYSNRNTISPVRE